MISIVDADPDLAEQLDDAQLQRARHEALTRVQQLSPGEWDVAGALEPDVHHRGFLIVKGLLSREVDVLGRCCIELIGPCDVMRPWSWDEAGSHVQAEVGWEVLEPTQLAVLDHALVTRINPWPQLGVELFNRGDAARAPSRGGAGDRAPPARRGPTVADALASRRALGQGDPGRDRPPAAAQPSAAGAHRRRAPPVGDDGDGGARQGGPRQPPRRMAPGCCTAIRPRSCATTSWRRR